jgi:RNA polymerase sigma factor (sigma-70 family)
MTEHEWLAERFEQNRPHLRAVAYRMLGSLTEADDAVQEAWLRLHRSDAAQIENLGGWLTTVIGRVCLDILRTRKARREESYDARLPDFVLTKDDRADPECDTSMADSIGLALLVVLDSLAPAERLAFVLHDMFAVPFDEIASILGCTPMAARQDASRARRKVQGAAPAADTDVNRQREVVDAFLEAVRHGDFEKLLAVLDPQVVLRSDHRPRRVEEIRGARAVAEQAALFSRLAHSVQPVLVNGSAGFVSWLPGGEPFSVLAFTIRGGRIIEIDILRDPERLRRLNLSFAKT